MSDPGTHESDEELERLADTLFQKERTPSPVPVTPPSIQRDDEIEEYQGDSADQMEDELNLINGGHDPTSPTPVPSRPTPPPTPEPRSRTRRIRLSMDVDQCHVCDTHAVAGVTLEGLADGRAVCQEHAVCAACEEPRPNIIYNLINVGGWLYHYDCLQCTHCKVRPPDGAGLRQVNQSLVCTRCGPCECGRCNGDMVYAAEPQYGGNGGVYNEKRILFEHRRCEACDAPCLHDHEPRTARPRSRPCVVCNKCAHDDDAATDLSTGRVQSRQSARVHLSCSDCFICRREFEKGQRLVALDGNHVVHVDCIACAICHARLGKSTIVRSTAAAVSVRGAKTDWIHSACLDNKMIAPTQTPRRESTSRSIPPQKITYSGSKSRHSRRSGTPKY
jgi:hypothetical protein